MGVFIPFYLLSLMLFFSPQLDKKKEPFPQAAGLNMQEGTKTLK